MDDAKRVGGNEIVNALRERGGKTAQELKVTSLPSSLSCTSLMLTYLH